MLPCLLRRVGEFCCNPQDLLTRDDLAAFLESEYGLARDDAQRLIGWLITSDFLTVRTHRGYAAEVAAVIDSEILCPGQAFIDSPFVALAAAGGPRLLSEVP